MKIFFFELFQALSFLFLVTHNNAKWPFQAKKLLAYFEKNTYFQRQKERFVSNLNFLFVFCKFQKRDEVLQKSNLKI